MRALARASVVLALPVFATLGVAASTHAATVRLCGSLAFSPGSEDGVGSIRAVATSCKTARRVARAIRPLRITEGPYTYRAAGYACRGKLDDEFLPVVAWRCTRGRALVTFTRA